MSVWRLGLVAGLFGSVPERLGAEQVEIKAVLFLLASLHTYAHSHTWLALGVEEAGWHPLPDESSLTHSSITEGPGLSLAGYGGCGRGQPQPGRHLLARGIFLLGIPHGLTLTCRGEVCAGWPGKGNVR